MAGKDLADDVVVKILYRLPVKSLLRFRWVSKRRRLIISDPQFAKSQFELASSYYCSASEVKPLDLEPSCGANWSFLARQTAKGTRKPMLVHTKMKSRGIIARCKYCCKREVKMMRTGSFVDWLIASHGSVIIFARALQ